MNTQEKDSALEAVLGHYMESSEIINIDALNIWRERYPQFAKKLTEFTIDWLMMDELYDSETNDLPNDDELVERALKIVDKVTTRNAAPPPFIGILESAKQSNHTLNTLAKMLRLSASVVRKIDRHLILYETIPQRLIDSIAGILNANKSALHQYLQLPPTLIQGVSYKSEITPTLSTELETFTDAIQYDLSLSQEDRDYWLPTKS